MRAREWVSDFGQDLRYAARGLAKRPGFTTVAVLTLAIGIGATTAIFSAVNALILRPLPFRDPDALMRVTLVVPKTPNFPARDNMVWSYPKYVVFRDAQAVFSEVGIYSTGQLNVTGGEAERVGAEFVGGHYLQALGISPQRGRLFSAEEDAHAGARKVVIIADGFWQRRYNADPGVIGRSILVDREPHEIVGVAPRDFRGLSGQADLFVPVTTRVAADLSQPFSHEFQLVARRKPGVTVDQAAAAVVVLGTRVNDAYPSPQIDIGTWSAKAAPLDDTRLAPRIKQSLLVLFGAVTFVLLIACVNLANLLLGRASARRREIAIRLALGAGRGRLVRLLLTESVLLSLLGAATSIALAWWGTRALSAVSPAALRGTQRGPDMIGAVNFTSIHLDGTALLFTLGVALFIGVAFGLAPALGAASASLTDAIKEGGTPVKRLAGIRGFTARRLLVVTEVALALVLLAGSGLMIRSLTNLLGVDAGFDPHNVLTLRLNVPDGGLARDSLPSFYAELLDQLAAVPGVTSVGLAACPPLSGGCSSTVAFLKDRPEVPVSQAPMIGAHWVTPAWFTTMRVPLKQGRVFAATDRIGAPKVIIVNEAAARAFWPGENPVGKRLGIGQGGFEDAEVIGVVGDVRTSIDVIPKPDAYVSYNQSPRSGMIGFLRTAGDPVAVAAAARRAIREIAPEYPVYDVQTMESRAGAATAQARMSAVILGLFAVIALTLAVIGIYGVMSFAVTQRTREIGIRMALGADRGRVLGLVIREGVRLAAAGAVVGVAGAAFLTRLLASLLFEVRPSDPVTYVAIVSLLAAAALVASWIPARRAAKVDPTEALRAE